MMRAITYAEAVREGLREEMKRDPKVFVLGQDLTKKGGTAGFCMLILPEANYRWRNTDVGFSGCL